MANTPKDKIIKMERKKTKSRILTTAIQRIKEIEAFAPDLDFGNDKSLKNYKKWVQEVEQAMKIYNQKMSEKNQAKKHLDQKLKNLAGLNTEMLAGVKAIYGRDSTEYEKMGGIPYSKRKNRTEK
jgi:hypothetical protein